MKVFVSNDFKGHWPTGTAAIVIAKDKRQARKLLIQKLKDSGLDRIYDKDSKEIYPKNTTPNVFTLQEISLDKPECTILCDGNY